MNIKTETFRITDFPGLPGIPAVLYGEKSDKVYLYLHGKHGRKEEALALAPILCEAGWQILAVDLPEHGERCGDPDDLTASGARKECYPWVVIPEWQAVVRWMKERYDRIALCAVSMSAWILMRTFRDDRFDSCLFISPIVDMRLVIEDKMRAAGITASDLGWKQFLPGVDGEMIVWDYYAYASYQPINRWDTPTEILYADGDALQPYDTVKKFADRFGCRVTVIPGEHFIPLDTQVLQNWVREKIQ